MTINEEITLSNLWWNNGLRSFLFRDQATETLEELVSAVGGDRDPNAFSDLEDRVEQNYSDVEDFEEDCYSESVEYLLENLGYEMEEDEDEDIDGCKGVGGVDWYHAVWVAQNELGIDFNKSYFSHPQSTMYELADLGKRLGYRRSYDNGKSYGRAFFDALARRADKINAEMARYDR